jgi:hypothetical protein
MSNTPQDAGVDCLALMLAVGLLAILSLGIAVLVLVASAFYALANVLGVLGLPVLIMIVGLQLWLLWREGQP